DGEPLSSLSAAGLPAGASFTPGPGDSSGIMTWTPGFDAAGVYTVTFTAANALSGTASTTIMVKNVDRAPAIAAPATASVAEGSPLTLTLHAADPDGDAITSMNIDATGLPAGNDALLTRGAKDSTGVFTWTPTFDDAGRYTVTFFAANR